MTRKWTKDNWQWYEYRYENGEFNYRCHFDSEFRPSYLSSWNAIESRFETWQEVNRCTHDWEPYYGLIEQYSYCKNCDEKTKVSEAPADK